MVTGAWGRLSNRLVQPVLAGSIAALFGWLLVRAVLNAGSMFLPAPVPAAAEPERDKIYVAFRNDDLSVFSDPGREDSVVSVFRKHGVTQTYAFIPNPAGYLGEGAALPTTATTIIDSLRAWRASGLIEFGLHGATHVRSPRSAGEFDGVPAAVQQARLREAKAMTDSMLSSAVSIFAPPWNASDCATVRACRDVGLTVFSGYLGICPQDGVTPVNTAAELFPDSSGLPSLAQALAHAREGRGERILVCFYHSRVDFNPAGRYEYLDSLLGALGSDPRVEWTTIGELAAKRPNLLALQNSAGYTMLQADRAVAAARPYDRVLGSVVGGLGRAPSSDPSGALALQAFWRGQFDLAAASGRERLLGAILTLRVARLTVAALTVVVMIVIALGARRWPRALRLAIPAAAGVLLPLIALGVITLARPFSDDRICDLTAMLSIVIGTTGLFLALQVLRSGLSFGRAEGEHLVLRSHPNGGEHTPPARTHQ